MIAIIDYKAGNVASVKNAFNRLGVECLITSDHETILSAQGVIFPGQGRAGTAMKELKRSGIDTAIKNITRPFLGICLGMQLLADFSQEDDTECLSIIKGKCQKLPSVLKTPHLGWNKVEFVGNSPLIEGIRANSPYFYFVHSYYFSPLNNDCLVGKTPYGFDFASMVQKDNFFATQFHPEKSGKIGETLLSNFCKLCGR
ncbi:MAG: imidazole glycerol phosphate synthase subunit HisH [Candidatus Pacebacteria bacterium]|nr:imidazole glycerol phosphate synthase subunit HisH [Candidatus Paceibacterota bacterium]